MQHKQHKQHYSRPMVLFMALVGLIFGVLVVMLSRDIAMPQQSVEKPLDVQTLKQ